MRRLKFRHLLWATLPVLPAVAQGQPLQVAAMAPLDEVVVTAGRIPVRLDEATTSVSVVTAEILERRQQIFVLDALAAMPGVSITQNGSFGGQAGVRIRGAQSEQTTFLVDGVTVNDTTSPGGGFNIAFLDSADIERVEVLRGPQGTLWGSDAIGGVVNIVSKTVQPGIVTRAFVEGGSFATRRGGGSVAAGFDRVDVRLGASAIDTDGISKAEKRDGNRESDPYRNVSFVGRAGWNLAEGARLEAFGRYSNSRTAFDSFGSLTGVTDGNESSTSVEGSFGIRGLLDLLGGRLKNEVLLSQYDISRRNFTRGAISFDVEGRRRAAKYQGTLTVTDRITVAAGAEREKSSTNATGPNRSTTINGLFALAQVTPVDRVVLNAGIRRDDHSRFGTHTTPRLGASFTPVEALTLRGSWGKGFKAPSIYQLYNFFAPATAANPNLKPETATGWDAGTVLRLLDGSARLEATYFRLKTENLLQFSAGTYTNIAQARSRGVEFAAAWDVTETVSLTANYTHTDAVNALTGGRLVRVPRHTGFLEIDWQATEALGFTLSERYEGERTDSVRPANPRGRIGGWARTDLAARYDIASWAQLYLRAENLFDKKYQEIFGYGTPGRSVFGGVRVKFE